MEYTYLVFKFCGLTELIHHTIHPENTNPEFSVALPTDFCLPSLLTWSIILTRQMFHLHQPHLLSNLCYSSLQAFPSI